MSESRKCPRCEAESRPDDPANCSAWTCGSSQPVGEFFQQTSKCRITEMVYKRDDAMNEVSWLNVQIDRLHFGGESVTPVEELLTNEVERLRESVRFLTSQRDKVVDFVNGQVFRVTLMDDGKVAISRVCEVNEE